MTALCFGIHYRCKIAPDPGLASSVVFRGRMGRVGRVGRVGRQIQPRLGFPRTAKHTNNWYDERSEAQTASELLTEPDEE